MKNKITVVIFIFLTTVLQTISSEIDDNEMYFRDRISLGNIQKMKKNVEIIQKQATFSIGSFRGFFTFNEIINKYSSYQTDYSDFHFRTDTLAYTFDNNPIIVWWFGNPDSEFEILFTGMHHANEPSGMMVLTYFIENLLEIAADNPESLEALLLRNRKIAVLPCLNPDGYIYNQQHSSSWRKNRSIPDSNSPYLGVDLNRNYGPEEFWDSPHGYSSTDIVSVVYRGPYLFSEVETQAVKRICEENNFRLAMNYHSFGDYIIYPYSALARETSDSVYFREMTHALTGDNRFLTGIDSSTVRYHCRGTSDDWMYLENDNKSKIFAMTVEIGNYSDGKYPEPERMDTLCYKNYSMNLKALECAGYSTHIKESDCKYHKESNSSFLNIEIVNSGRESGLCNFTFSSLSDDIVFPEPRITLEFRQPGEKMFLKVPLEIINKIQNGSVAEIVLRSSYPDDVSRLDTFQTILWDPDVNTLYSSEEDFSKWFPSHWGWGIEKDILSGRLVLSDSPGGDYRRVRKNYLTYSNEIDLEDKINAYLRFDFRLITERKYDAALVQVSIDLGNTWNNLEGNRMIRGESLNNGVFLNDMVGLTGVFPDWTRQKIDLKDYCGNKLMLRFLMLSDTQVFLDGMYLDSIMIFSYDDKIISVNENVQHQTTSLYPNPIKSGSYINFNNKDRSCIASLFNLSGKKVIYNVRVIDRLYIPEDIAPGLYYLLLNKAGKNITFPVFVR